MSADFLTVGGKPISPLMVVKLRDGAEPMAAEAAKENGADDVFFSMGQDTYVASGRGFELQGVKKGDPVSFQGRTGTVTGVDAENNTVQEGANLGVAGSPGAKVLNAVRIGSAVLLAAGVVGLVAGSALAFPLGGILMHYGLMGAGAGFGSLVVTGLIGRAGAAYGASRKVDANLLRGYGEAI